MFILPKIPSFGEDFAHQLTQGLSKGVDLAGKLSEKRAKVNSLKELVAQIEKGDSSTNPFQTRDTDQNTSQQENFLRELMSRNGSGEGEFNEKESQTQDSQLAEQLWNHLRNQSSNSQVQSSPNKQKDPYVKAKAYAAGGSPELARVATEEAKMNQKQIFEREKEDREILNIEPKKFMESIHVSREKARDIDRALSAELDSILSGEVDPFSSGHISEIIKQFDLPPALAAPLETVGSKSFKTGQKTFLTNTFKDAFRGATTKGQIELASSLLSETGAPKEANLATVFFLQAQHMIEKEKVRLTDEALEEGVPPHKLPRFVDRKLEIYAKDINDQYFESLEYLRDGGLYKK